MKSKAPISNDSKLITIASGKGGVGKTWLSTTLAQALSRREKKIALFDGDLGMANIDIQIGLMPDEDIGSVISGDRKLEEVVTRYTEPGGKGGFDVLAGKSGSGALGSLAREKLRDLRNSIIQFTGAYDHVILDMAAGIDPSVTTLSHHRGRILVVMTADPTSLTDAYAFIKVTQMRNPQANISVIVNNVATKKDGERVFEAIKKACEGFLKISPKLAAIIKTDNKVQDAIRTQTPLFSRHPQSEAAETVLKLADDIISGRL
ncbi:P-loop NTPase [Temperatibacter marinus]|uniref:P-loop NTPase n=1 Tax=Temperatibacter marinus TaxID=1456591 RepID=A0AA52EDK2_9PROT|nr:P-loop NTPase [Temperatibacter marinus]WND02745.1 P-loop NTPase [Temperatibacter marinus]